MTSTLRGTLVVTLALTMTSAVSRADVPTVEQDCRNRNSALCESGSIQFVVEGPCPATARTIRPSTLANCDDMTLQVAPEQVLPPVDAKPATSSPVLRPGHAPVERTGRWLLLVAVAIAGVLVLGAIGWIVSRCRRDRGARDVARSKGQSVMQFGFAALIAGLVAWQAAGVAFNRVFGHFDNHDSAAPLLLAAPAAFAVFLVVLPAAFAVSVWLLRLLGQTQRSNS